MRTNICNETETNDVVAGRGVIVGGCWVSRVRGRRHLAQEKGVRTDWSWQEQGDCLQCALVTIDTSDIRREKI